MLADIDRRDAYSCGRIVQNKLKVLGFPSLDQKLMKMSCGGLPENPGEG